MKNLKRAAKYALILLIIKLVFRLIPPADQFFSIFELGIGYGLLILFISYAVLVMIIWIILVIIQKINQSNSKEGY